MSADYNRMSDREESFWQGLMVGIACGALLCLWIVYGGV